jgi:hypothetical protein
MPLAAARPKPFCPGLAETTAARKKIQKALTHVQAISFTSTVTSKTKTFATPSLPFSGAHGSTRSIDNERRFGDLSSGVMLQFAQEKMHMQSYHFIFAQC